MFLLFIDHSLIIIHIDVSNNRKSLKYLFTVNDHMLRNSHDVTMDDVRFIAMGKNDKELLIKESLLVKKLSPIMNGNVSSYPLELF